MRADCPAPYTLYRRLPAGSLRQLRPRDLDNADRPILRAAGITTTWRHDTNVTEGVTFAPPTGIKAFDATAAGFAADDMAELHPTRVNVNALFGAGTRKGTPTEVFLVMGVGSRCTLVGPEGGLMDAPVSFGARRGRIRRASTSGTEWCSGLIAPTGGSCAISGRWSSMTMGLRRRSCRGGTHGPSRSRIQRRATVSPCTLRRSK